MSLCGEMQAGKNKDRAPRPAKYSHTIILKMEA